MGSNASRSSSEEGSGAVLQRHLGGGVNGREGPSSSDVRTAGEFCRETLESLSEEDWLMGAGTLEWNCRATVAHISDALGFYGIHLAARATAWLKFDVVPHGDASNRHLARLVGATGEVLAQVVDAAPPGVRAYHHSGMWDRHTLAAFGCLEAIVHTGDVAAGLSVPYQPPRDVCDRVATHLFAPARRDEDPWSVLWWATGRGDLEGEPRLGATWMTYWMQAWSDG